MKSTYTYYILLGMLLCACSSPESDGKKAAEKFCDCERETVKSRQKGYTDLIQNFDSYSFQTRVAAREKIQEITDKVTEKYKKCVQKAERFYNTKSKEYVADYQKNEQFEYAFQGYRKANEETDATIVPLVSRMNNLILEIIPPRPDLEKLKKDLVGRKIAEGANGYRKKDWYWEIKSTTELKNVDIKNTSNNGEDYVLDVYLILQGENTDYNANVKIYYVLRQYDDWTIDMIETQHKYHDVDIEFARTVLNKIKHRLETEDLNPEESFQLTRTYNAIMEKYMQYVNDSINQNAIMERYMQYVNDSINQNAIINKKHKVPK